MPQPFDITTPRLIRTQRLVLRSLSAIDAAALVKAIIGSLDHLRTFMPWAHKEPQPVEKKAQLILDWQNQMNTGGAAHYGLFERSEGGAPGCEAQREHSGGLIGAIGIHRRIGAGAGEIGYWIRADRIRHGYTTEAAAALTRIGFECLGLRWMEIQCDVANAASNAIPQRLGYTRTHTIRGRVHTREARPADMHIWTMRREEFAASEAAARSEGIEVFDALGRARSFRAQP